MINSNLVDDFLSYLSSTKGASENTIREYYYDIRTFLKFIIIRRNNLSYSEFEDTDIDLITLDILKSVSKIDIYAYYSFLDKNLKNSNRTKHRKISSVRSFFNYLTNKIDLIDNNPLENIDLPKISKSLPIYLTLDEALNLLNTIKNSKSSDFIKSRDYTMVTLFLNCGMRLSELSSLNIYDIKLDNTLRVIGKGNKERTIYLNKACLNALDDYLNIRPKSNDKALFLSNRNTRISNRQIQRIVEKYVLKSGLDPNKYTVHKLRHTAATLMYQYGDADIRSLQEVLGHESVSTTEIYTHVNSKKLRNTVENNPLANLEDK